VTTTLSALNASPNQRIVIYGPIVLLFAQLSQFCWLSRSSWWNAQGIPRSSRTPRLARRVHNPGSASCVLAV
jgi:hypothetical protein